MWSTKDIACIICLSVLGLVSTIMVGQMATLFSGIQGANYIFTIILATIVSFSMLVYEGRRWRVFAQYSLFTLLIIPTYLGGAPFTVQTKIQLMTAAFIVDLVFNSFYKSFKQRSKLALWSISATVLYYILMPFFSLLQRTIFYPPEAVTFFANVILWLFPVIIFESIAGGYLGYRIYIRVKNYHL